MGKTVGEMADPPSPAATSFRARTVSTPSHAKASDDLSVVNSWTVVAEDRPNKSATKLNETRSRETRSNSISSSYFSVPKAFNISSSFGLFSRRRKNTAHTASRTRTQKDSVVGDVIEIGPGHASRDEKDEEAERERLRDAAAQALGLGLGREEPVDDDDEDETEGTSVTDQATQLSSIHQPTPQMPPPPSVSPAPPSLASLPRLAPSPSITTTAPMPDIVPPYPCALSALTPYIQTRSSLLRYHPSTTFLALSLTRRTKQWRIRHVILTAPLPPPSAHVQAGLLSIMGQHRSSSYTIPQHAHLHLFKNAAPTPDELEIDRLEINEDSVVFVAEHEIAGRRDVVKVGGRDARGQGAASAGTSVKSVARSWHSGVTSPSEPNIEEMGRTMWLLKMADSSEMQSWIEYIKTAVLVQRAERAGMTFQHNGGSMGVPSMRADLDVLLSLRSQGLLPSIAAPSRSETLPGSHATTNGTAAPNSRFSEHVGAAPSHLNQPSVRSRTYPLPHSNVLPLPSLKGLFSSSPLASQSDSRPPSPQQEVHADIDPIGEENTSLGTRASALFNMFRSNSRTSHSNGPVRSRASMTSASPAQRPYGIGSPITPVQFTDETIRKPSAGTSFSVDWSTMQDGNSSVTPVTRHASVSLPPPPRNYRRPWAGGGLGDDVRDEKSSLSNGNLVPRESEENDVPESQHGPRTPTPPVSPLLSSPPNTGKRRPPSLNSTSSYTSVERDHLSDFLRWQSRTVPKMLAPPTGPPPNAPPLREHSPSLNSPPSPISEQNNLSRNGSGRLEQNPSSTWSGQTHSPNHPYSKRVSSSSARSVNTISTVHSFLSSKSPPPPRPPPNFAPPPAPAPSTDQASASTTRHSPPGRESLLPRSLRLSLLPPTAPPTHSLPPRPDEPAYRHRRSTSSDVRPPSNLFSIPGSPAPPSSPPSHPPAPPPPNGPLPPTPTTHGDMDGGPGAVRTIRPPSLTRRLRIMSTPATSFPSHTTIQSSDIPPRRSLDPPIGGAILPHPDDHAHMFLHMNDTPTTPATTHSPSFLHVSSPIQPSPDDAETTSLSPPPRRNSRASKEIQRAPNLDREEVRYPNGASFVPGARDSAIILDQN